MTSPLFQAKEFDAPSVFQPAALLREARRQKNLPEIAAAPCALARLPKAPDRADLEIAYMTRGAQLVACDGARRLAVETLLAERAMRDRWGADQAPARRRFWPW